MREGNPEAAPARRFRLASPATALVLGGVAAVIGVDLRRSVSVADRLMANFVDGLFADSDDRPAPQAGAPQLHLAIARALDRQRARRQDLQRRLDFAEALADNVAASLFVVDEVAHGPDFMPSAAETGCKLAYPA